MSRECQTRSERLYKLDVLQKQASKQQENFARDGLFPRYLFHPELLSSVSIRTTDAVGVEYVSLSSVVAELKRSGTQGIELWNLNALQSKHDINEENYYEKNSTAN